MGKPKASARCADLAGAPPKLATLEDLDVPTAAKTGRRHAIQRSSKLPGRINLKAVADALADAGLDPTEEMIRILQKEVPVFTPTGKPLIDPKTKKQMMRPAVDDDTKLRTLNELLQYTQPKLKAMEMKVSGSLELTAEELDQRLALLLSKAVKR
jgi:hypothetical protein